MVDAVVSPQSSSTKAVSSSAESAVERASGEGSPTLSSSSARRRKNSSRSRDRFRFRSPNFSCSARRVTARCSAASISSTSSRDSLSTVRVVATGGTSLRRSQSAALAIPGGEKRFADEWQAVEPAERLDHDIGRDDIFLEIVEQGVAGFEKFFAAA